LGSSDGRGESIESLTSIAKRTASFTVLYPCVVGSFRELRDSHD
jgi:hypothetical protein